MLVILPITGFLLATLYLCALVKERDVLVLVSVLCCGVSKAAIDVYPYIHITSCVGFCPGLFHIAPHHGKRRWYL